MDTKNNKLEDFICVLSFQEKHFLERPITLRCGHSACIECFHAYKKNSGLSKFNCFKCDKENNLENDYFESDLIKNYMSIFSEDILNCLNSQYDDLHEKYISNIELKLYTMEHYFVK